MLSDEPSDTPNDEPSDETSDEPTDGLSEVPSDDPLFTSRCVYIYIIYAINSYFFASSMDPQPGVGTPP